MQHSFIEIQEAYDVLGNPEKKKEYDRSHEEEMKIKQDRNPTGQEGFFDSVLLLITHLVTTVEIFKK